MSNGNGSGLWRWLAAFLAGLIIALLPSLWAISRAPSEADLKELTSQVKQNQIEIAHIQERLDLLFTVIENRLNSQGK